MRSSADARICTPIGSAEEEAESGEEDRDCDGDDVSFRTEIEPIWYDSESQVDRCVPFGAEPSIRIARFWRPELTAKDAISKVGGLAPRRGLNATRSIASANTIVTASVAIRTIGHPGRLISTIV